jgi:hypothetical protein
MLTGFYQDAKPVKLHKHPQSNFFRSQPIAAQIHIHQSEWVIVGF